MTELDKRIENAVNNNIWIVYRQPVHKKCPNCEILKEMLRINDISFVSINIATPEAMTELAFRGSCFPKFTPVLQKGYSIYYRQLWKTHGKELHIPRIRYIIDPDKQDWIDTKETEQICKDGICEI